MTLKKGTPQSLRVVVIDHGTPYAVFLQNTPLLGDAVPRAMPWAGMRCPFRANCTMGFRSRVHALFHGHSVSLGWYAMPLQGKLYDGISIPRRWPPSRALRFIGLVCDAPSGQIERWLFDAPE